MIIKCRKCDQRLDISKAPASFKGDVVCPKCGRSEPIDVAKIRAKDEPFDWNNLLRKLKNLQ